MKVPLHIKCLTFFAQLLFLLNSRAASPGRAYSPTPHERIASASTRVTSPSREENQKRKQYREEQMQRASRVAQDEARLNKKLEEERMAADHVRLEARRAAIRDRIAKQIEVAQRLASEVSDPFSLPASRFNDILISSPRARLMSLTMKGTPVRPNLVWPRLRLIRRPFTMRMSASTRRPV